MSKVARLDWPREWPNLFPTLLQAVESPDSIVQHRALLTLHHVVKAIASKRLAGKCLLNLQLIQLSYKYMSFIIQFFYNFLGDRRLFQEFTSNIYTFILNLWNNFTEAFVRNIMQNASTEVITTNLEKALLTLRILRKLTVFGFYKPEENQDCMSFMKVIFEKAKTALQCRK